MTTNQLWLMIAVPSLANIAMYGVLFIFLRAKFNGMIRRFDASDARLKHLEER